MVSGRCKIEYLVKWKNLGDDKTSWETVSDLKKDRRQRHQIVETSIDYVGEGVACCQFCKLPMHHACLGSLVKLVAACLVPRGNFVII